MKTYIRTHLNLARISNLPTTWSNVLCAFLLVGGLAWAEFLGAIVAVSFFYIGGMYLNDWRDAEHDRKHQTERPIPSQKISRRTVLVYAVAYFGAALGISVIMQPESMLWSIGLIACITVYDLDHKENSMSPWVMAGCRALIYPWAASLAGQGFPAELWIACAAAYTYTLGLTYIARGPAKAFSIKIIMTACVMLPAVLWGSQLTDQSLFLRFLALAVFLAWTGYCLSGWFSKTPKIGFTVGNLIAGFCFVDLLAISIAAPISVAILLLVLLFFMTTLKLQTLISGT